MNNFFMQATFTFDNTSAGVPGNNYSPQPILRAVFGGVSLIANLSEFWGSWNPAAPPGAGTVWWPMSASVRLVDTPSEHGEGAYTGANYAGSDHQFSPTLDSTDAAALAMTLRLEVASDLVRFKRDGTLIMPTAPYAGGAFGADVFTSVDGLILTEAAAHVSPFGGIPGFDHAMNTCVMSAYSDNTVGQFWKEFQVCQELANGTLGGGGGGGGGPVIGTNAFASAPAMVNTIGQTNVSLPSVNNQTFTTEASETNPDNPTGFARSMWWKITPAGNGTLTLDTGLSARTDPGNVGVVPDTLLAVYTGASLAGLVVVAHNDDDSGGLAPASKVSFAVTGGTTYYIQAAMFSSFAGLGYADIVLRYTLV